MAKNAKKPTKKSSSKPSSDENVVRIKAGASSKKAEKAAAAPAAVVTAEKPAAKEKSVKKRSASGIRGTGVPRAIGGYFKGAWQELRLVRWPTRSATWSLTFAVLVYSAFFVVLVLLLDAAFKYLFELILGK